jgi:hypothetical protein
MCHAAVGSKQERGTWLAVGLWGDERRGPALRRETIDGRSADTSQDRPGRIRAGNRLPRGNAGSGARLRDGEARARDGRPRVRPIRERRHAAGDRRGELLYARCALGLRLPHRRRRGRRSSKRSDLARWNRLRHQLRHASRAYEPQLARGRAAPVSARRCARGARSGGSRIARLRSGGAGRVSRRASRRRALGSPPGFRDPVGPRVHGRRRLPV